VVGLDVGPEADGSTATGSGRNPSGFGPGCVSSDGTARQVEVSSDLHEWRNDGQAVSTRDSVKLNSL